MRITRDQNPHDIKRYSHIKPAPIFGPMRCLARYPGRRYTCTLAAGHEGPHTAHGWFSKVMAVWDETMQGGH